jgi:CBS domain-containing protein
MFRAKDLMTTHVISVAPEDTIDRAVALMVRHRISGLPVVDQEGCPVGIVSEFDLLELICEGETEQEQVSHYMTRGLVSVNEEDSWVAVADLFREKRIRRLPVLRDGKLAGIITRHDLMHAIRDARLQIRRKLRRKAGQNACTTHKASCAGEGRAV